MSFSSRSSRPLTRLVVLTTTVSVAHGLALAGVQSAQASTAEQRSVAAQMPTDDPEAEIETSMASLDVPQASGPKSSQGSGPDGPDDDRNGAREPSGEAAPDANDIVAKLAPTRTKKFGLVGVTWEPGVDSEELTAQIRLRSEGEWTDWQELEIDSSEQTGQTGSSDSRAGTEPTWVGEADGVAVRLKAPDGETPEDVKVATVDGDKGLADRSATEQSSSSQGASATASDTSGVQPAVYRSSGPVSDTAEGVQTAATPRPDIVTRQEWGVDRRWESSCSPPRTANKPKGVVLHHTAGNNSYSRAEAPGIVRAAHLYHTKARNWCDIGYNFLVDKYGTIYEGRRGGIEKQVRGAHAGNFEVNHYTTGVSMMGNFETARLTKALKRSVVQLIAWRLSSFGLSAKGKISFDGERIHRISGHRDIYNAGIRPATSTACPGRYGYDWLTRSGGLRDRVAKRIDNGGSGLYGVIEKAYQSHKRLMGKPRSGVRETNRDGLTYANFAKGRIYARNNNRAYLVWGTIDDKHRDMRAHRGVLRGPRSSVNKSGKGLSRANFDGGRVFSYGGRGYGIWGTIDDKHRQTHALNGVLGRPRTDVRKTKGGVYYANFAGGRIYSYGGRGYVNYGPIDDKYRSMRSVRSSLGRPTSDIMDKSYGQRANYENGRITWIEKTGEVRVTHK